MQFIKILGISIFILALFFVAAASTRASEGTAELRSTVGQPSRCFVSSTLMKDFSYSLLVSCRDLIYPPAPDMFAYLLWAISPKDGKFEKIGELGVGKAEFKTDKAFSGLFVTKERSSRVGSPSEPIIMQGDMRPIGFLETPTGTTPQIQGKEGPLPGEEEVKPSPASETETRGSDFLAGVRRAAIVFVIVLFAVAIIVIALISTFRRLRE